MNEDFIKKLIPFIKRKKKKERKKKKIEGAVICDNFFAPIL
jgi:hypothetical protein